MGPADQLLHAYPQDVDADEEEHDRPQQDTRPGKHAKHHGLQVVEDLVPEGAHDPRQARQAEDLHHPHEVCAAELLLAEDEAPGDHEADIRQGHGEADRVEDVPGTITASEELIDAQEPDLEQDLRRVENEEARLHDVPMQLALRPLSLEAQDQRICQDDHRGEDIEKETQAACRLGVVVILAPLRNVQPRDGGHVVGGLAVHRLLEVRRVLRITHVVLVRHEADESPEVQARVLLWGFCGVPVLGPHEEQRPDHSREGVLHVPVHLVLKVRHDFPTVVRGQGTSLQGVQAAELVPELAEEGWAYGLAGKLGRRPCRGPHVHQHVVGLVAALRGRQCVRAVALLHNRHRLVGSRHRGRIPRGQVLGLPHRLRRRLLLQPVKLVGLVGAGGSLPCSADQLVGRRAMSASPVGLLLRGLPLQLLQPRRLPHAAAVEELLEVGALLDEPCVFRREA
mmetsp:Transcript_15458/g.48646  ORF Transcript_15458/g.48646 Transcript_15458/m.48646 type:complete len:453 (+) Transcript_15458:843-2201(+)